MNTKEEALNTKKSAPHVPALPYYSRIANALIGVLAILIVAFGCLTAHTDDRFGFATHFNQGWPAAALMPAIASTGVGFIRDDINVGSWETSAGVYVQPAWDIGWLTAAKTNHLKVVAILGPNKLYADPYDPVAMSNLAVYIAKTGLVTAFEITNEPNNAYQKYEGASWQTSLSALTNAVSAAVHAAAPGVQVIGFGAQGTQIFNMLAMGTTIDGVVYHPYYFAACIPETVYEWQYLDYGGWITAINAKTKLPKWETEWGVGTTSTFTTTHQANFLARRLLQEAGLGVEHSFIYEFMDNGTELYGVERGIVFGSESWNPLMPKPSFYVVKGIISALYRVNGGTGSFVTVNSVANGDLLDVKAYAYQGSINKTVVAYWFGNHDPRTPPPASTCSLTFTVPRAHAHPYVMNAITGIQVPLSKYTRSESGTQVTVAGLPISDQPQIIVMQ